jgi:hypothetical protein
MGQADRLLGGGPLGGQDALQPGERRGGCRVLVAQPLEELDLAVRGQRQAGQPAQDGGRPLRVLAAEPEQAVGQLVGLLPRGAALDDPLGQPTRSPTARPG